MLDIRINKILLSMLLLTAPLAHADSDSTSAPKLAMIGGPMHQGMPPMAGPHNGDMPPEAGPQGAGMPPFMGRLELSEAQQDKLFQLQHQQAPAIYAQQKAARKAADALRALIGTSDYSAGKAKDLAQAEGRARAELALMRAQGEHEFLSLLTDEQKKELAAGKLKRPARDMQSAGPRTEGSREPR